MRSECDITDCLSLFMKEEVLDGNESPVSRLLNTVKILKIRTPGKFAVIILKFEQCGFTIEKCVQKWQTVWQTV